MNHVSAPIGQMMPLGRDAVAMAEALATHLEQEGSTVTRFFRDMDKG